MSLIPGLGRSPGGGNGNPLHILASEIRLQSMGLQKESDRIQQPNNNKNQSHKERVLKYGLLKPKKDYPDEVGEFLHGKMMKTEKLQDVTRKIFLKQKGKIQSELLQENTLPLVGSIVEPAPRLSSEILQSLMSPTSDCGST